MVFFYPEVSRKEVALEEFSWEMAGNYSYTKLGFACFFDKLS